MKNKNAMGKMASAAGKTGQTMSSDAAKLRQTVSDNKAKNNQINKSGGTDGTSTAGNKDNNQSQENNGKEKSKGQQTAQEVGTEAAKQALKKAAGVIPWTKWIPKNIRDKIIDKFMDSETGQAAVEKEFKKIKTKVIMIAVSAVASVFGSLIMIGALYGMIAAPVGWISDVLGAIGDFFSSVWNAVQGKGWCATDSECQSDAYNDYYDALEKAIDNYSGKCEINEDLITATIFYGQMVSEEKIESDTNDEDTNEYDSEADEAAGFYYNYLDVSEASFRQTAKSQINKLLRVYLRGEGMDAEDLDSTGDNPVIIDEDNPCSISSARYREYLIDTYIDWAYPSVVTTERTKEVIADEILQMGGLAIGGADGHTGEIIVGAGEAGEIPIEILSNCTSPLGTQQMSHTSCFKYYSPSNCTAHSGIDIGSSVTDPELYSIADGEVITVVSSATHCQPDWKNGKACSVCAYAAGNRVTVKHSVEVDGTTYVFYSEYMHMKRISVDLGQKVSKGQKVGIMGNTGCSTATHLHFNMLNESKQRYNPEELLQHLDLPRRLDCDEARRVCSGG